MVKVTYKPGDKVFAKVKGYPPWPARIEGDTGKKKYNVLFYGTQETGAIKPEDLCYYSKNKANYVHKYLKRAGYEDAVKQIEEAIKTDGGDGNDGASVGDESANDIDMSDTSVSSVPEKKAPKRKVASLPDEPVQKKTSGRPRRKSLVTADSKDDYSEEPAPKKARRKSNASTDNESKEDAEEATSRKPKTSSDNGIQGEIIKESLEENEEGIEKVEEKTGAKPITDGTSEELKREVTVENSETETGSEIEVSEKIKKDEKTEDKGKSAKKKNEAEDSKKPKETEFVEIENNADSSLQMEEEKSEETEKTVDKSENVEIVTEQMLNNNILYAEHVKKNLDFYKDKPVEARQDSKDQVLPVKLPSGTICGIKLHKEWPLEQSNEHDRALYDEQVAKTVLEIKDKLLTQNKALEDIDSPILPDIQMTSDDIKEVTYAKDIESKRSRLDRLKKESELVTWDSKIKNNLGLDKALPDSALECLKEFHLIEKNIDALMFKKHPHVLDTVHRLRKYVGNVKEWDMTAEDMEVFTKKAEKIRLEAEKIYNKIKGVIKVKEEKGTFWEAFMDLVSDFRIKCKNLSESEVLVLCAEPDSRQAFLDKLDELSESEGTGLNTSNTSEPVLKESSVQGWTETK